MTDRPDPTRAAQIAMRPPLPKRFWTATALGARDGLFVVELDGKPARTPARAPLAVPFAPVADVLLAEWSAVGEVVDPAVMPMTRLVSSAIDAVAGSVAPVRAGVARYLASDLLCYRADRPDGLVARQSAAWDPILGWAAGRAGAPLQVTTGVGHVEQPADVLRALADLVPHEPLALAACETVTSLTGSAVIALALVHGRLDVPAAWAAAHVDEDWNIELWGSDAEAAARRAFRFAEMEAAGRVLEAAPRSTE